MKRVLFIILITLTSISINAQISSSNATNWNQLQQAGFYHSLGAEGSNTPLINGQYWWGINMANPGNVNSATYYNAQIAVLNYESPAQMYVRSTNKHGMGIWAKILHDQGLQNINGNLHLAVSNTGSLRIGKIGDNANVAVPVGAKTVQYNIDFSGYQDVTPNQIGARIAAIRFNKYQNNKAYVQNTGLAFYTNEKGYVEGESGLVERIRITPYGNVGIGTTNPTGLLDVAGTIRAQEVKIEATGWSDFVFDEDYRLPALSEVENHIKAHKHLPDVPSEKQVIEEGVNVVEMQAKLLQKIEELTLYTIELEKKYNELKEELADIKGK